MVMKLSSCNRSLSLVAINDLALLNKGGSTLSNRCLSSRVPVAYLSFMKILPSPRRMKLNICCMVLISPLDTASCSCTPITCSMKGSIASAKSPKLLVILTTSPESSSKASRLTDFCLSLCNSITWLMTPPSSPISNSSSSDSEPVTVVCRV